MLLHVWRRSRRVRLRVEACEPISTGHNPTAYEVHTQAYSFHNTSPWTPAEAATTVTHTALCHPCLYHTHFICCSILPQKCKKSTFWFYRHAIVRSSKKAFSSWNPRVRSFYIPREPRALVHGGVEGSSGCIMAYEEEKENLAAQFGTFLSFIHKYKRVLKKKQNY